MGMLGLRCFFEPFNFLPSGLRKRLKYFVIACFGMDSGQLEQRIFEIGSSIITAAKKNKKFSMDKKIFEMCMKHSHAKTQLLRFIDVLPSLKCKNDVLKHLEEYLLDKNVDLGFFGEGIKLASIMGNAIPSVVVPAINYSAKRMARNFLAADSIEGAVKIVQDLSGLGMEFSIDALGEKTTSNSEADSYMMNYLGILDVLSGKFGVNAKDTYRKPKIHVSMKLSSLCPKFDPTDIYGASQAIKSRLRPIFRKAKKVGAAVNIDTEQYHTKDMTSSIFREILEEAEFNDYNRAAIVVQAYLKDSEETLKDFINWGEKNTHQITIRLVKGAYWDHEVMLAQRNAWELPVFSKKQESDANYEKLTRLLLSHNEYVHAAIASHNIRSMANALALKESMGIGNNNFEIQMLYGMGDDIKKTLADLNVPLRVYTPFGNLISGMGYFVRRLLENSANESFLRAFDADADPKKLLMNPLDAGFHGDDKNEL